MSGVIKGLERIGEYVGLSKKTLVALRARGEFPTGWKLTSAPNSAVCVELKELDAWLASRKAAGVAK